MPQRRQLCLLNCDGVFAGYQMQGYYPRGGGMYRGQPRFYNRQFFRPTRRYEDDGAEGGVPRGRGGGRRPYNRRRRPRQEGQKGDAPQVRARFGVLNASSNHYLGLQR